MIDAAYTSDPALLDLLKAHPKVGRAELKTLPGIEFYQGPWRRTVVAGDLRTELFGLVELLDNNPMVCADAVSVPDPASTLALIAVGPIALASLIVEPPTLIVNLHADEEFVNHYLTSAGWNEGATLHTDPQDGVKVAAATAIAKIQTPESWSDIDDLYEERFGRSFFVRREEERPWDSKLVEGTPFALYNLRYTPGDGGESLLTIQTMADLRGKCGMGQLIHAMNVMAGLEESLGIA